MADYLVSGAFVIAALSLAWAGYVAWRHLRRAEEDMALETVIDHVRRGGLESSLSPELKCKAERAGRRKRKELGGGIWS